MKKYIVKTSAVIVGVMAAVSLHFGVMDYKNDAVRWLNHAQPIYAQSAYKTSDSVIYLNGDKLSLDRNALLVNGSTLVPLRGVFDKMGIEVEWLPDTRQVYIEDKGKQVIITPGVNTAMIDGEKVSLSSASIIQGGSTYVPLRFISETFNYIVGYDKVSRSINISTKPYEKMVVNRVIDGDTFDVSPLNESITEEQSSLIRIRAIGLNTPENTEAAGFEPGGKEASEYAKEKLLGKTVYITLDKTNDPYGRTLAYIHLETGEFVNASLISEGYAEVMTIAPNTLWSKYFEDLEVVAKERKLNLWVTNKQDISLTEQLLSSVKEAGLNINPSDLSKSVTNTEASSMLLYMLYPEARGLIAGYKLYQIATDDNTKEIISQLYTSTQDKNTTVANGAQIRALILSSIGLKEDSVVVGTLDKMGLLPSSEQSLTVGEMVMLVDKLKAIMPTIDEIREKAKIIETGISKLKQSGVDLSTSGLLDGVSEHLTGLKGYISGAAGWVKDTITSIFNKKLTNTEINNIVNDTVDAAKDIQSMLEDAYGSAN